MENQKRSAEDVEALLDGVSSVILDIEGTTTPITFVKDQLFPYFLDNVEDFLTKNFDSEETQSDMQALRELATKDKADNLEGVVEIPNSDSSKNDIVKALVENVKWQVGADRKSTELKRLQGNVWREGYKSGDIKSTVFDDVEPVVSQLMDEGVSVYIYSSGSAEAQKLLFEHTEEEGDISDLFTDFFDTTIGSKTESSSYLKIANKIGIPANQILFITDNFEEAEAAVKADMRVAVIEREGNDPLTDEQRQKVVTIGSLGELFGEDMDPKKFEGEGNGDFEGDEEVDEDEEIDEEEELGEEEEDEEEDEEDDS